MNLVKFKFFSYPFLFNMHFFPFSFMGKLQDQEGKVVYEKPEKPRIHTDGTGFISEDLALICGNNVHRGERTRDKNIEVCDFGVDCRLK